MFHWLTSWLVLTCSHRWFEGFNWEGLRKGTLTPPIIPTVSTEHWPPIIPTVSTEHWPPLSSPLWVQNTDPPYHPHCEYRTLTPPIIPTVSTEHWPPLSSPLWVQNTDPLSSPLWVQNTDPPIIPTVSTEHWPPPPPIIPTVSTEHWPSQLWVQNTDPLSSPLWVQNTDPPPHIILTVSTEHWPLHMCAVPERHSFFVPFFVPQFSSLLLFRMASCNCRPVTSLHCPLFIYESSYQHASQSSQSAWSQPRLSLSFCYQSAAQQLDWELTAGFLARPGKSRPHNRSKGRFTVRRHASAASSDHRIWRSDF